MVRSAQNKQHATLPVIPEPIDWKKDSLTLLIIALVCIVQAAAINGFYTPHRVLSGGFAGLAVLINFLTGLPAWPFILLFNIPTCLIGFKHLRPKTVLFSIAAPLIFTLCFSLTGKLDFGVENPLLSIAAGASILGVTGSLVVNRDATMGGTDVLALILSRRFSIPMGTFSLLFNLVIMGLLGLTQGLELALLSIMASFAANAVFNYALRGFNRTNTVMIFTNQWQSIAPILIDKLKAGVTFLHGEGGYSHEPREVIVSVVRSSEIARLKAIVKHEDPTAFFMVIETKEVVGRGFNSFT